MAEGPRSAGMVTCIACARVRARKRRRRLRRDPPPGLGPTAMMIATGVGASDPAESGVALERRLIDAS
jgi:hypothetical protein